MALLVIESSRHEGIEYRVTKSNGIYRFQAKKGSVFETRLEVSKETFDELAIQYDIFKESASKGKKLRTIIQKYKDTSSLQAEALQAFFYRIGRKAIKSSLCT